MTGFDFAVIAILLVSLLIGAWRGLVREMLSLLGWPIAFVMSKLFANDLAPLLPMVQEALLRTMLAYALVFIAALILWSVLVWLLSRLVKASGLGWLDRVLGGVFGVVRGGLVLLVMVWLAGLTDIPKQPYWHNAKMSKAAEDVALLTKTWLPDNIARRIHYGFRS